MTKYLDEITSWMKERQKENKSSNRARQNHVALEFLSMKSNIQEALDVGITGKLIWLHMTETDRIRVSYPTFMKYIRRHIQHQKSDKAFISVAAGKINPKSTIPLKDSVEVTTQAPAESISPGKGPGPVRVTVPSTKFQTKKF